MNPNLIVTIPLDEATSSKIQELVKKKVKPTPFTHGRLLAVDFIRRTALAEFTESTPGTKRKKSAKKRK